MPKTTHRKPEKYFIKKHSSTGIHWSKSILFKIVLLSWFLILVTLCIFILSYIPYHTKVALQSLESEAQNIASSIGQVSANAIILEDYSFAIDHCLKVVKESNTLQFVIITKNNGFSLIHQQNGWNSDTLDGIWNDPQLVNEKGTITLTDYAKENVFLYSYHFKFSGYEWGWIHIGLSLKDYYYNMDSFYVRMFLIFVISSIVGLFLSIIVGKGIAKPIKQLDIVTREIAKGNRRIRAVINSGDELENLAESFNKMTDSLYEIQDNLEERVNNRTKQLTQSNKLLEKEIAERKKGENVIKASLQEKEILLKEVHHRVKNNLQIVCSLLYLQAQKITDPDFKLIFTDSRSRIKCMALIHEKLYCTDNFAGINISDYISCLIQYLHDTYITNGTIVTISSDVDVDFFNLDTAIPCGLIINELVTNSLKHAFTDKKEGKINIELKPNQTEVGKKYQLKITDNGKGLGQNFNQANTETLGLQLITNLTKQLDGEIITENNNGASFTLYFNGRS